MKKNIVIIIGIFTILNIFFSFGCSKNKKNNTKSTELVVDSANYYQYQIATVTNSNIDFKESTYYGDVDGKAITLRAENNILSFLVPDITAGVHDIKASIDGEYYSVRINVVALPAISDPDIFIATTLSQIIKSDSYLDSLAIFTTDMQGNNRTYDLKNIVTLKNYHSQFTNALNNATAAEKLQLAKIIVANPILFSPIQDAITLIDTNTFRKTTQDNNEQTINNNIKRITAYLEVNSAVTAAAGVVAVSALASGAPLAAMAALAVAAWHVYDANKVAIGAFNQPMIPEDYDINSYHQKNTNASIIVDNNTIYTMNFTGNYRNIYNHDSSSSLPLLISFFNNLEKLGESWNYINTFLPTPLDGQAVSLKDITNFRSKQLNIHSNYLTISNISNSSVSSVVDNSSGTFKVKFSTSETSDQNFTFDVVYDNPSIYTKTQSFTGKVLIDTLVVGKFYQGGIIGYILQPGDPGYIAGEKHGLIILPVDIAQNIPWGCGGTFLGTTSTSLGTGAANTEIIASTCGPSSVARACYDLVWDGYNDWYLPSVDELYNILNNRDKIDGNWWNDYPSSSEYGIYEFWAVNIYGPIQKHHTTNKLVFEGMRFRAVRSF